MTTGEDSITYLHLQLFCHERRSSDKLIAQGLIQVCLSERMSAMMCDRASMRACGSELGVSVDHGQSDHMCDIGARSGAGRESG